MQRSIELDDAYTLRDGQLMTLAETGEYEANGRIYKSLWDVPESAYPWPVLEWAKTKLQVGTVGTLCTHVRVGDTVSRDCWFLHLDPEGVPGNLNPKIKSRRGWRGTTNNISCDAHGLAKVVAAREIKRANGDKFVRITVRTVDE